MGKYCCAFTDAHIPHDRGFLADDRTTLDHYRHDHEPTPAAKVTENLGAAANHDVVAECNHADIGEILGRDPGASSHAHPHGTQERNAKRCECNERKKGEPHEKKETVMQIPWYRCRGEVAPGRSPHARRQDEVVDRHDDE